MALEIERRFLIQDDSWRPAYCRVRCRQGYLVSKKGLVVRVRIIGEDATLAVKTQASGIARNEYEYAIPLDDAQKLLGEPLQGAVVEKVRHYVTLAGRTWEIDVFEGANAGLSIAEIELADADETFDLPAWAGLEITEDERYLNANLALYPYDSWK